MSDWRKLDERRIRDGWAAVIGRRYEMPDGETLEFEIKAEGPTAVVLALTPAQEVVLVREFRPGVEEELLELPGGLIEGDEAPTDAARRELLEETGYAGDFQYIGGMVDCAYSTRIRHVCIATNAVAVAEPTPQAGEFPEVVTMPLDDFREHLRDGRLTDVGPGYRALDALNLL